MKIAILGAPGSGKSKIAKRVIRRLNTPSPEAVYLSPWCVIDGYVERLQNKADIVLGATADLRDNLQIIAERWILENQAQHLGKHTITCGSIYESVIYSAAQSVNIPRLGDEQLMLEESFVAKSTMELLGILERRYFDYDAMFFLPKDEEEITDWNGVVNAKLPEVLEGFMKHAVVLDGTDRQKVDRATDIIISIQAALYSDQGTRTDVPESDSEG